MENNPKENTDNYPLPAPEVANMQPLSPEQETDKNSLNPQANAKSSDQFFNSQKTSNLQNNILNKQPNLEDDSDTVFKINH